MAARQEFVAFGAQIYKVIRPFAELPPGRTANILSKCDVDAEGNLYISQRTDPPVLVFDRKGKFIRSIGDGRQADSHGIFVMKDGSVLLVDRDAHQLVCYSPNGDEAFTIGEADRPRFQAPFSHPTDVVASPSGDIFVADGYGNTMVHKFSADGTFVKSWGGLGTEPGQFTTPHGIDMLPDGRLLVGDRENNRIQVFNTDGDYLTEWHGFYHPMDIHVESSDRIYVTDQRPRVTAVDGEGRVFGSCKPALLQPHGMCGGSEGTLYIVDTRTTITTKLEPVR